MAEYKGYGQERGKDDVTGLDLIPDLPLPEDFLAVK